MRNNNRTLLSLLLTFLSLSLYAQVGINTDGSSPDASAMLDIKSTSSGLLIPRMTVADRDAIASPATGLMVFITDDNSFYYYNGTEWVNLSTQPDEDWQVNGDDLYSIPTGNVGIGTSTPEKKLEVNGEIKHGNALSIYSNSSGGTREWVTFNSPDNGYGDNVFLGAGGTTVIASGEAATTTKNNIDTTNGHETFYISSDNNFKLTNNLQDGWDTRIEALQIDRDRDWHVDMKRFYLHDSVSDNHSIRFMARTDYNYGYGLSISPGQGLAVGSGESGNSVYNNVNLANVEILYLSSDNKNDNEAIKFITSLQDGWDSRIEAMTIIGNGNVGIGTNTPGEKLDINGAMHLTPGDAPATPDEGDMYMDATTHKLRVYDGTIWHDLW